jgi:hypothetical protein
MQVGRFKEIDNQFFEKEKQLDGWVDFLPPPEAPRTGSRI